VGGAVDAAGRMSRHRPAQEEVSFLGRLYKIKFQERRIIGAPISLTRAEIQSKMFRTSLVTVEGETIVPPKP
jgi:hypothetical protein